MDEEDGNDSDDDDGYWQQQSTVQLFAHPRSQKKRKHNQSYGGYARCRMPIPALLGAMARRNGPKRHYQQASQQVLSMCRWREQRVCVRNQSISQLMRTTRSLIKTPEHTETVSQTLSRWLFQQCQNTRARLPSALHCSRSTLSGSRSRSLSLSLYLQQPPTHTHTPKKFSSVAPGPLNGVTHSLPERRFLRSRSCNKRSRCCSPPAFTRSCPLPPGH